MLKEEIKRGVTRKSFWITFLVIIIFSSIYTFSVPRYSTDEFLYSYLKANVYTSYDCFIFFNLSRPANILILILPLLSSLVYSDTYVEDSKSGFLKFIYIRGDKKKYLRTKFLANFILSGVAVAIPIVVSFVVLKLRVPSVETNPLLGVSTILQTDIFPKMFYSHPNLYIALWIGIYFIYAGLFSSVGLSLSIFIRNKIVVLFSPFIIYHVGAIIIEFFQGYRYYPASFLYLGLYKSFAAIIIEFILIMIISYLVFIIGGNKRECI